MLRYRVVVFACLVEGGGQVIISLGCYYGVSLLGLLWTGLEIAMRLDVLLIFEILGCIVLLGLRGDGVQRIC